MKLKYPLKKYLLPWFLLLINTITIVRLGNPAFIAFVALTSSILYWFLRSATRQLQEKNTEIEILKATTQL